MHIQAQLVNLLNENRALHICLAKLHMDMQEQLKEISLNQTFNSGYPPSSTATSIYTRKSQSTLKKHYI